MDHFTRTAFYDHYVLRPHIIYDSVIHDSSLNSGRTQSHDNLCLVTPVLYKPYVDDHPIFTTK